MGSGFYSSTRYASYSSSIKQKSREQIFKRNNARDEFLSKNIKKREAFDSDDHPESNAIIIGVDVTGSMGILAETIVRGQLGTLMSELINREPVKDPQVCFMAIGDIVTDNAPLQVTQFESDDRIVSQITDLWLEGCGGGNHSESYTFPWLFALNKVSADSINKRNKKGYIITIGDEQCPERMYKSDILRNSDISIESDYITSSDLYSAVKEKYDIFHIIIEEGSHCRVYGKDSVMKTWTSIIGNRAICLSDHRYLSNLIVSIIQINEGKSHPISVIESWEDEKIVSVLKESFLLE